MVFVQETAQHGGLGEGRVVPFGRWQEVRITQTVLSGYSQVISRGSGWPVLHLCFVMPSCTSWSTRAVSQPHEKFCESGFTIIACQMSKQAQEGAVI